MDRKKLSFWEEAYRGVEQLWGLKPDPILMEYANLVLKGKVLDLGIGEGRNALYFARMGYEVEGIDVSQTAVERCIRRAKDANLKIKAEVRDLIELRIPERKYSLIIAAWVLNFFKKKEIEDMVSKIKHGIRKGGLVYIGVFSIDDPGYVKRKGNLEMIEEDTFYSKKRNSYIHYFTREEVLSLFADFKIIYCAEGRELDTSHNKPHYHGFIVYMGEK